MHRCGFCADGKSRHGLSDRQRHARELVVHQSGAVVCLWRAVLGQRLCGQRRSSDVSAEVVFRRVAVRLQRAFAYHRRSRRHRRNAGVLPVRSRCHGDVRQRGNCLCEWHILRSVRISDNRPWQGHGDRACLQSVQPLREPARKEHHVRRNGGWRRRNGAVALFARRAGQGQLEPAEFRLPLHKRQPCGLLWLHPLPPVAQGIHVRSPVVCHQNRVRLGHGNFPRKARAKLQLRRARRNRSQHRQHRDAGDDVERLHPGCVRQDDEDSLAGEGHGFLYTFQRQGQGAFLLPALDRHVFGQRRGSFAPHPQGSCGRDVGRRRLHA